MNSVCVNLSCSLEAAGSYTACYLIRDGFNLPIASASHVERGLVDRANPDRGSCASLRIWFELVRREAEHGSAVGVVLC